MAVWDNVKNSRAGKFVSERIAEFKTKDERECKAIFMAKQIQFTRCLEGNDSESIPALKDKENKKLIFWGKIELPNGTFFYDENKYVFKVIDVNYEFEEFHPTEKKTIQFPITIASYMLESEAVSLQIINKYVNSVTVVNSTIENFNFNPTTTFEQKIDELDSLIKNSEVTEQLVGLIEELKELIKNNQPVQPNKFKRFAKYLTDQMFNVLGQILAGVAVNAMGA